MHLASGRRVHPSGDTAAMDLLPNHLLYYVLRFCTKEDIFFLRMTNTLFRAKIDDPYPGNADYDSSFVVASSYSRFIMFLMFNHRDHPPSHITPKALFRAAILHGDILVLQSMVFHFPLCFKLEFNTLQILAIETPQHKDVLEFFLCTGFKKYTVPMQTHTVKNLMVYGHPETIRWFLERWRLCPFQRPRGIVFRNTDFDRIRIFARRYNRYDVVDMMSQMNTQAHRKTTEEA
jgi:hypothetical protein